VKPCRIRKCLNRLASYFVGHRNDNTVHFDRFRNDIAKSCIFRRRIEGIVACSQYYGGSVCLLSLQLICDVPASNSLSMPLTVGDWKSLRQKRIYLRIGLSTARLLNCKSRWRSARHIHRKDNRLSRSSQRLVIL
jgi:hypothetical protein